MVRALFSILFLVFSVVSSATVVFDESTESVDTFNIAYYVDETHSLPFDDITLKPFKPAKNRLSLGTNAKTTWVKFQIKNNSSSNRLFYLHIPEAYHAKAVTLYQVTKKSNYHSYSINLSNTTNSPYMHGATAVIPLALLPNQTSTVYLRNQVYSHQWFSLSLHTSSHSKHVLVSENFDIAILVGMLISLMMFNIMLFISSNKIENIFYALYLVSGTLWIALSYGFVATIFSAYGDAIMIWHLSLLAMPIFLILFMMWILQTKKTYPTEHKLLLVVLILLGIDFLYGTVNIIGALKYASSLAALMIVITLSVSISLWRKGNPLAKLFLLGHSLFFIFNLLAIGYYKGVLPNTYITSHGVGIGIVLEALMLAFIIAYRMKMLEKIKNQQAELEQQAHTDPLTQLYNRRYFDQTINAWLRDKPSFQPISIAIADIDNFKLFNDTHGHQIGDEVLVAFADILKKFTPNNSLVARLGGEEFIIALTEQNSQTAVKVIEQLRIQIAQTSILTSCNKQLSITASFGICQLDTYLKPTIICADKALYAAKKDGRNCVKLYSDKSFDQLNLAPGAD